jgi:zinc protease
VIVAPLRYAETPAAATDASREPRPALAPVHELLDEVARDTTLPNGLRVVFVPRHDVPVVALRLVITRGAVDVDDTGAIATAQMAYFYQRGGSEETYLRTSAQAGRLGTRIERWDRDDGHQLGVKVGSRSLAAGLALLADLAIGADLSEEEYSRQTIPWRDRTTHLRPIDLAMQRAMLFGTASPYGHAGWGRAPIDRAALRTLRAELFQPAHATLVVVGDAAPAGLDAAITRSFGAWAPATPIPSVTAEPPYDHGVRIAWRERGGMTETLAAIFFRGPVPLGDDMDALTLATAVLGAPSSRLFTELREDQGAVYTPDARLLEERSASWVTFESLYDPDKLVHGLHTVVDRIHALRAGVVDEDEIEAGREVLAAVWRGQMATASGAAQLYAEAVVMGRSLEQVRAFPERVARLRKADVVRVANLYLTDPAMRVAVVGGVPDIEVGTLGLGPVRDIKLGGP